MTYHWVTRTDHMIIWYIGPILLSFSIAVLHLSYQTISMCDTGTLPYMAQELLKGTSPLVEQAVVYSTLPQEYSTLTFRGEVVAWWWWSGREERSVVLA